MMDVDPEGYWSWKKFFKALGAALLVVASVIVTVAAAVVTGGMCILSVVRLLLEL